MGGWLWRSFGGAVGDGDFRWGGGLVAVVGCCVKSLVSQVFLGLGFGPVWAWPMTCFFIGLSSLGV